MVSNLVRRQLPSAPWLGVLLIALGGIARANPPSTQPIADVRMQPDGVLWGRVFFPPGVPMATQAAARRVTLWREQKTVAVTTIAPNGRFALRNLPSGLYQVVVEDSAGPGQWSYRVWSAQAAPPRATAEMHVPLAGPVLRGQHITPFPVMSLQKAATLAGIAGGAIMAPVIYHNALIDNRGPASP